VQIYENNFKKVIGLIVDLGFWDFGILGFIRNRFLDDSLLEKGIFGRLWLILLLGCYS
jgi:hypothetical protein